MLSIHSSGKCCTGSGGRKVIMPLPSVGSVRYNPDEPNKRNLLVTVIVTVWGSKQLLFD